MTILTPASTSSKAPKPARITKVETTRLHSSRALISFADGVQKTIDIRNFLTRSQRRELKHLVAHNEPVTTEEGAFLGWGEDIRISARSLRYFRG